MLPTVFVFVQEFVYSCICVAVISGSKKLLETQLTRGNRAKLAGERKLARRVNNSTSITTSRKKGEPVQNGSWSLIDSHLLSGYNLCWNHFEKLYLDLSLHIVKPYI